MSLTMLIRNILLIALIIALNFVTPVRPAYAASLVVNTLTDENDLSCVDGDCSLRDAVEVASAGDTITFSVIGTITLTLGEISIDKNLTINGPGATQLTVSGNDASRVFNVTGGVIVSISGLTIDHGYVVDDMGAGVRAASFSSPFSLTLDNVVISNSVAATSAFYPRGGGIGIDGGTLTLTNSTISGNSAGYSGGGIAILNSSSAILTNVTVNNNDITGVPGYGGGGIAIQTNPGYASILTNVTISNNTSTVIGGGLLVEYHDLSLIQSTVTSNSASDDGGGLFLYNSATDINSSTFNGNAADGASTSDGGAIANHALGGMSTLTISNSTFSGNTANNGYGGAIRNSASGGLATNIATTEITNSTIVENNAQTANRGGGLFATTAGGAEFSSITLSNSIVYGNTITSGTNGENCSTINGATIVTNDHNLLKVLPNDCTAGATDITSSGAVSTIVDVLASNGGPTQTRALVGASPAIDAGNNSTCTNTDQRGIARPIDGDESGIATCDIGAYEYAPPGSATVDVSIGGANQGSYGVLPQGNLRQNYSGVNDGPMQTTGTNSLDIIPSTRVLFGGVSYSELMGFPANQLTNEYIFPSYNNVALNSQLRVGNLGGVSTTITVTLGATVIDSYILGAGLATRKNYAGQNSGPLRVASSATNILATIRALYNGSSYSELMGYPTDQLTTEYIFPYYNNVALDSQLRVSNLGVVPTTITVTLGTNVIDSYILGAGLATRKNYAGQNSGPLRVASSATNIISTIRALYNTNSYSELMGYPVDQLTDEYWYPVYDNVSLDSQLRVSNVGAGSTTITVYSGGTQIDTYSLAAGAAKRKNYAGEDDGPLQVVSSAEPILSTIRMLYLTPSFSSFYEMTGFPNDQLTTEYWFPWYNNTAFSSQLRMAVP